MGLRSFGLSAWLGLLGLACGESATKQGEHRGGGDAGRASGGMVGKAGAASGATGGRAQAGRAGSGAASGGSGAGALGGGNGSGGATAGGNGGLSGAGGEPTGESGNGAGGEGGSSPDGGTGGGSGGAGTAGQGAGKAGQGSGNAGASGCGTSCPTVVCDGDYYVETVAEFEDFVALRCREVTGRLTISVPELTSLDGLVLESVGDDLRIDGCDGLTTLAGLEMLTTVDQVFLVESNAALTGLDALESLTDVTAFYIFNNPLLSDLNGLEGIRGLDGYFDAHNNPSLSSLDGLDNLSRIDLFLVIANNPVLTSLSGLDDLTKIGWYASIRNNGLTSLEGLGALTSLGADGGGRNLEIVNNAALVTLDPLHDWPASALRGEVRIHDNVKLPACEVTNFDTEQTTAEATCVDECDGNTGAGTCS
jgi:hypothetical protein